MKISKIKNITTDDLVVALVSHFNSSRFVVDVSQTKGTVDLKRVRLKESKHYCGNHPKACDLNGVKHKKAAYLEGADWVEFNDRLNGVLDRLNVSALVSSSVCNIRQGLARRIVYDAKTRNAHAWVWDKIGEAGHYSNCCGGSAPRSSFPEGTPGIYEGIGYNVEG
jgi:hypothetical protein